jgi:surface antigen
LSAFRPPYIGRRPDRQSATGDASPRQSPPFFRAGVLAVLLLSTAGCARLGLPSGAGMATAYADGAAINASVADGVDPSDWEVVRQTVAGIAPASGSGGPLVWQNPRTGSSGTLDAKAAEPGDGGICRAFSTTVNDLRGIRRYRGEACRPQGGSWQLTGIIPDDSALL